MAQATVYSGTEKDTKARPPGLMVIAAALALALFKNGHPHDVTDQAEPREHRGRRRQAHAGHAAVAPTDIPARGWKEVLFRVKDEISRDNMSIVAAGCAFYGMFALFPAITALVAIYGIVADPATVERQINSMQGVMPEQVLTLIRDQAHAVASAGQTALGWGAALSIVLALWSASAGIKTIFTALNIAYEEDEDRGFLRFNVTALAFTLGAILAAILGLAVIIALPIIVQNLALGAAFEWAVRLGSWVVLFLLVVFGLGLIYRFGPSRAPANWRWISPGALLASLLWVLASAAFSFYAANFASYNETYGALGGVIVLLMWLYISAFIVLLGAELNSELELQTSQDTTTGRAQPRGARQAWAADHVPADR